MTAPVTSPRADQIAEDLLRDARAFLATQGAEFHSRQVEALARAVARHLAALEDLFFRETVSAVGSGVKAEFSDYQKTLSDISAAPAPLRDAALGQEACQGSGAITYYDPADGALVRCRTCGKNLEVEPPGFLAAMSGPIITAIVPVHQREVVGPPQPRMLIVQRWDREAPENVPEGEVRWGLDLHGHLEGKAGRERAWFSWGLCEANPRGSKVPYVRQSPDSPWGIRVEILGEGR